MNLKNKIENKIESLRTSILKCSVEQKFLRAYFLKLSFNLMLTAVNKWKSIQSSQSQSSNVVSDRYDYDVEGRKDTPLTPNRKSQSQEILSRQPRQGYNDLIAFRYGLYE